MLALVFCRDMNMDAQWAAFGAGDPMAAAPSSSAAPVPTEPDFVAMAGVADTLFPEIQTLFGEFDSPIVPIEVQSTPVSPVESARSPVDIVKNWRTRSRRQSLDSATNERRYAAVPHRSIGDWHARMGRDETTRNWGGCLRRLSGI